MHPSHFVVEALRRRSGVVGAVFLILALPRAALANPEFVADHESGALLAPQGDWDNLYAPRAGNTVSVEAAAAHRGTYGLRHVDGTQLSGAGFGNAVQQSITPYPGNYYARMWTRITSSNGAGRIIVAEIKAQQYSPDSILDVIINVPDGSLEVGGFDRFSTYSSSELGPAVITGTWHLLEFAVTGVGSVNGTRAAWMDGALIGMTTGLDWTGGGTIDLLEVGQPWSELRTFTGTVDFDDVRSSATPLASTLVAVAPVTVTVGACVPFDVSLRATANQLAAPAPYPVDVTLQLSGASGSVFEDSACGIAFTGATLAQGASSMQLYVRATAPGTLMLRPVHVDFLSGTTLVDVTPAPDAGTDVDAGMDVDAGADVDAGMDVDGGADPDAGTEVDADLPTKDPRPMRFNVGCGCGSASPSLAIAVLLLVAGFRRGRPPRRN